MFNFLKKIALLTLTTCLLQGCNENANSSEQKVEKVQTKPVKPLPSQRYDIGNHVSDVEISGWDIDVRPDGKGLPNGEGSVEDGEVLFEEKCAVCHGAFGEGEGRWPKLAGGEGTLKDERPEKTVGSYWPYASTLFDYIRRAMPFTAPQSLTDNETYAITAYVLNLNDLVDDDFVLSKETFSSVEMPNKDGFYRDNRPDVKNPRCMENCKDPTLIVLRHTINGITPSNHFKKDGNTGEAFAESEHKNIVLSAEAKSGQTTYDLACKVCHDTGVAGAPKLAESNAWQVRIDKGVDVLFNSAINGFNGMPAKGGQTQLTDAEVKQAVQYMIESSQ